MEQQFAQDGDSLKTRTLFRLTMQCYFSAHLDTVYKLKVCVSSENFKTSVVSSSLTDLDYAFPSVVPDPSKSTQNLCCKFLGPNSDLPPETEDEARQPGLQNPTVTLIMTM